MVNFENQRQSNYIIFDPQIKRSNWSELSHSVIFSSKKQFFSVETCNLLIFVVTQTFIMNDFVE